METLYPRLPRTSEPYALAKKDSDIREAASIESSNNSCAKEETSPKVMALEENLSMDKSSKIKTSN